jgi:hypothetical protein
MIIIAIGVDLSIILEEAQPLQLNTVFGQIPNLAYLSSSSSENQNNTFKRSPDYFPSANLAFT